MNGQEHFTSWAECRDAELFQIAISERKERLQVNLKRSFMILRFKRVGGWDTQKGPDRDYEQSRRSDLGLRLTQKTARN